MTVNSIENEAFCMKNNRQRRTEREIAQSARHRCPAAQRSEIEAAEPVRRVRTPLYSTGREATEVQGPGCSGREAYLYLQRVDGTKGLTIMQNRKAQTQKPRKANSNEIRSQDSGNARSDKLIWETPLGNKTPTITNIGQQPVGPQASPDFTPDLELAGPPVSGAPRRSGH